MNEAPRLTEAHVRLVHREIADTGPDPAQQHFSEEDYAQHLEEFLEARPEGPVQVFSYGSLIWRPAFSPVRVIRATAIDWHRSFCLHMVRWRGDRNWPGLMMQIDRGGHCEGVVQEIAADGEIETLLALWRREMTVKPPGNMPRWIDVGIDGRDGRAIAFTANPESPNYAGGLSIETIAKRIAFACGHWGSNAEYLRQTVTALERHGIHDTYLWDLQERVAKAIEERHPEACLA
jgi:glutathione-specific gamma-glutamylcyclotransferase